MSIYSYRLAGLSDVGRTKKINQDSFLLKMGTYDGEPFVIALVADGMGGVYEGEMASRTVRTAFHNWYSEKLPTVFEADSMEERLIEDWEEIIARTSTELNQYGMSKGYGEGECPGTTLCILFLFAGTHYIANVGDSRVYKCSDTLKQLTKDHSWAQQELDKGADAKTVNEDRRRNCITRCVGGGLQNYAIADYYSGAFFEGDSYLLCTDGLRHLVHPEELAGILNDEDMNTRQKCEKVISMAKSRGESDNITAIIIKIEKANDSADSTCSRADATEKLNADEA